MGSLDHRRTTGVSQGITEVHKGSSRIIGDRNDPNIPEDFQESQKTTWATRHRTGQNYHQGSQEFTRETQEATADHQIMRSAL